jgi:small subunit ribosomal protein S16
LKISSKTTLVFHEALCVVQIERRSKIMAVKIRLSRGGSKKRPFYRVVVADARAPRDGDFIEKLGTYNPMLPQEHAERVVLNAERVTHWLKMGAVATDRVARLFGVLGLMEKPVRRETPKQSEPGKKMKERTEAKQAKQNAGKEEAA